MPALPTTVHPHSHPLRVHQSRNPRRTLLYPGHRQNPGATPTCDLILTPQPRRILAARSLHDGAHIQTAEHFRRTHANPLPHAQTSFSHTPAHLSSSRRLINTFPHPPSPHPRLYILFSSPLPSPRTPRIVTILRTSRSRASLQRRAPYTVDPWDTFIFLFPRPRSLAARHRRCVLPSEGKKPHPIEIGMADREMERTRERAR